MEKHIELSECFVNLGMKRWKHTLFVFWCNIFSYFSWPSERLLTIFLWTKQSPYLMCSLWIFCCFTNHQIQFHCFPSHYYSSAHRIFHRHSCVSTPSIVFLNEKNRATNSNCCLWHTQKERFWLFYFLQIIILFPAHSFFTVVCLYVCMFIMCNVSFFVWTYNAYRCLKKIFAFVWYMWILFTWFHFCMSI